MEIIESMCNHQLSHSVNSSVCHLLDLDQRRDKTLKTATVPYH